MKRRGCLNYSLHALDVLHERGIDPEWVERVVSRPGLELPDPADSTLAHALAPIPERQGRVLRVVYNPNSDPPWVVTAFFDRAMRGKL